MLRVVIVKQFGVLTTQMFLSKITILMSMRYTYNNTCPNPAMRFHIEHSVFLKNTFSMHTHEFSELVIVRHGKGIHVYQDKEYSLSSGDVFVVGSNQLHGYRDIDGMILCNIIYDPHFYLPDTADLQCLPGFHALFHLEPELREKNCFSSRLHLNKDQILKTYELLDLLETEYVERKPGYKTVIQGYFTAIAVYLARQYSVQDIAETQEMLALSKVLVHIEKQYADKINLDNLASISSMSKNSLLRAFNRYYGRTPIDYLIWYRLEKARELLINTRYSITDIAYAVGFLDSNYFARKFNKQYRVSPRAYRKTALHGSTNV